MQVAAVKDSIAKKATTSKCSDKKLATSRAYHNARTKALKDGKDIEFASSAGREASKLVALSFSECT